MADTMAGSGADGGAAEVGSAIERDLSLERASSRGAYWTGARLFVALSAMAFGAGLFAYFYLHSLDNNTLWRTPGQRPSDFISVTVLVMTLVGAALYWWFTRQMLAGGSNSADWRVATGVASALFFVAALIQFWGMRRTGFFPGSSGYASVYVALMPLFGVYCLGAAYWLETLLARSIRVRWVVSPEGSNLDSPQRVTFAGSAEGAKLFVAFMALVSIVLFVLFSIVS